MKTNKCEYLYKECNVPYEPKRCLDNYEKCFIYQRFKSLEDSFIGSIIELPKEMKNGKIFK